MLARSYPKSEGFADRDGMRIHYEVFGEGPRAVLLLPTWSIVHSDLWRHQVAHLAPRYTVIAFDGRGNGASDRPRASDAYGERLFAEDALAVLDSAGVEEAAIMSVSQGGCWGLILAAEHADRVPAAVFISPDLPFGPSHPAQERAFLSFDEKLERYFGELFERHSQAIYNFCFRRTGDWTLAEDLTSAVFLEAWRKRTRVDLVCEPPLPWLYGVATNVLRNHTRSLRRFRAALERLPAPDPEPDFAADAAERLTAEHQMRAVLKVVDRLPRREREVLALCVWAELSYDDAAAALDLPIGTVRSRLARARARLRELVGEESTVAIAGADPATGGKRHE